ncbi:TIGR03905 family TSCPD domain-containing protein [Intestinimonas aquisgranensis]|uniref:TIGR03905 family TSCPD domain-containing protein n=1 Tax=Intestinimonas timonensis TaxID=1689270 RepID=UPI001D0E10DA|nr:TIGR03905 family TSCPD domain-containing protein [Intestinimonas timonensis]MCC2259070.1 TIGR03905 family TSCPD domain-containing protein [Intestinimonas aquisgranensis]
MTIDYKTKGTCSSRMLIEVEDGVVKSLQVTGGCNGNLQGLSKLVAGMKVEDVISRLEGIRCGFKPTSCPDQLAQALKQSI